MLGRFHLALGGAPAAALIAAGLLLANAAFSNPYFFIGSEAEWTQAMTMGHVKPVAAPEDWGDAPDSSVGAQYTYPTRFVDDGARHQVVPGVFLGYQIDAETDGRPDRWATGDDWNNLWDEDGVSFNNLLIPGTTGLITVTASIAGKLDAWIDWDGDGNWTGSSDRIFASWNLVAGDNSLSFAVPSVEGGYYTYARFRFSTAGGLSFTGSASDGEVEDYRVRIWPKPAIVNKAQAKQLPLGSYVLIERNVVTASFGWDLWYFQEPDRFIGPTVQRGRFAGLGVKVVPQGKSLPAQGPYAPGDLVTCYGQTILTGCELMLRYIDSWKVGEETVPEPITQTNRGSGGGAFGNQPGLVDVVGVDTVPRASCGTNSVALLVRLTGRCTWTEPAGSVNPYLFWIDDGSALWDGTLKDTGDRALGVKVRVPDNYAGPPIVRDRYYAVTGIMRTGTYWETGDCVRFLWPRFDSDIRVLPEPDQ